MPNIRYVPMIVLAGSDVFASKDEDDPGQCRLSISSDGKRYVFSLSPSELAGLEIQIAQLFGRKSPQPRKRKARRV